MSRRASARLALIALCLSAAVACAQSEGRELEILRRTGESYRALKSYHLEGSISVDVEAQGRSQNTVAPIVMAATPGRWRDEIRHPQLGAILVSDGKQSWHYVAQAGQYTRKPSAPARSDTVAFNPMGVSGGLLASYRDIAVNVESATLLPDETIEADGPRETWVVEVTYGSDAQNAAMRETPKTYWIDKKRHIVLKHRAALVMEGKGSGVKQTETVTFEKVSLDAPVPDRAFAFHAPDGAKEVDSFRPRGASHADLSGQEATDFTLSDLSGKRHTLKAQRGKVVMLDFWASWCGPCRMQMPNVDRLNKEFKSKGLVVYAINQRESAERAKKYLDKYNYSTTTLLDSDGQVGDRYKVTGIPSLVVIDRQGRIAAHMVGLHGEEDLRAALKKAGLNIN